jgi:hypothetical protein
LTAIGCPVRKSAAALERSPQQKRFGRQEQLPFLTPIMGFEVLTACGSMVFHFRSERIKATMEVTMLDRLVEVFCEVDDFCKTFQNKFESHMIGNGQGPRGPNPGLAEAEIITRLLVLHSSGFKHWKNFYNSRMGEVLRRYFPGMPG